MTLKEIVDKRLAVLDLGPVEAATSNGLERTYIRDIVEGRKKRVLDYTKLAKALKLDPLSLSRGEMLPIDDARAELHSRTEIVPEPVKYGGIVQAGQYLPVDEHFDQDQGDHMVPPSVMRHPSYPTVRQVAWQVRGDSMDDAGIRDGMWIVGAYYLDYRDQIGELYNGQYVVVERILNGGSERELTVKEVQFARGGMRLVPRSSNKTHKEFFVALDTDADPDTETVGVIAVVLSSVNDYGSRTR